jgi:hypothetical protein
VVGFVNVFQHTPRAEMESPPLDEMLPPLVAVVLVMLVIAEVLTVGSTADSSEPVEEPLEQESIIMIGNVQRIKRTFQVFMVYLHIVGI